MAAAQEVSLWAQDHPDASLADHEQAVLMTVRAVLPQLLEATLRVSTRSVDGTVAPPRLPCPGCRQRTRVHSWRPRQVQTICGEVNLPRPWYVCRPCRHGWSPTDAVWEIAPHQRLSAGFEAYLVRLGATTSFRDAAGLLDFLTGWSVAPETVRAHTEAVGNALEEREHEAAVQVQRTREPAAPLEAAPGALVVETDGVMVRYRDGWHEAKLGVVGGQVAGEMRAISYVAAREGPEQFGPRLLAEAARRGALTIVGWEDQRSEIAALRPVTVIGDGAPWIWNLAADHFATRQEIVDFYHASQHLWTAARSAFGQTSPATTAWAQTQVHTLSHNGVAPILTALAALTPPDPSAAEVLRHERAYFRKNAARMDYPTFRAQGLPLGSGAVESSGKHLVQQRMKRPGARWSESGAQALLTLRSHLLSERSLAA
jgi:Uncharacterised protein family (UPF0236)